MPNTLDLNLMVIARQAGMDLVDLPDLYIAEPPRNPARGRETDRLVLFLATTGQPLDPAERSSQELTNLANLFYKAPGSVTSALRQVAESINQAYYRRNLAVSEDAQRFARLACIVLRGDQAYLAQCGPVKTLVMTSQVSQEFYDPDLSSLGAHEAPEVRYFQVALQPNDSLLITALPPEHWSQDSLRIGHGMGPESVRRRILGQITSDLNAILVQARPGKGNIIQLRSSPVQPVQPADAKPAAEQEQSTPAYPAGTALAGNEPASPEAEEFSPWTELSAAAVAYPETPIAAPAGEVQPAISPAADEAASTAAADQEPSPGAPTRRTLTGCLLAPFLWLSGLLSTLVSGLARLLQAIFSRVLPEDTLASISNTSMAAIALIIPVAVVALASFVYFQRGVSATSQMAYEEASQAARLAREQTEPLAQRQAWEDTLNILSQAGSTPGNPEVDQLRNEAGAALDMLNQVRRVDYQPAIVGGLPAGVNIIRILSNNDTLYLLDGNGSTVYRANNTAQGYVLDSTFICTPNTPSQVGPLIDMLSGASLVQPPAEVVLLDPTGDLLSCTIASRPESSGLQPPTARTFTELKAFAQDFNYLYVLDPPANAVWVYPANDPGQDPSLYFDETIPPMQDTLDLAAAADELYLLHADGHLTLCQTSNLDVSPTRCTDPAPFLDSRPGLEDLQLVPANPYTQIQYSPPPDPALYLLEPSSQAVDLYSLQRLTYQRRYLPVQAMSGGPATAFAVDPLNRIIFLAAGNNVYYGRIP